MPTDIPAQPPADPARTRPATDAAARVQAPSAFDDAYGPLGYEAADPRWAQLELPLEGDGGHRRRLY